MGIASSAWCEAGVLATPAAFSSNCAVVFDAELPTVATTYVTPVAAIEDGAVYVTVQYVKACVPCVQLVAPSVPCPPAEPVALLESA
jgi:hypothetical protein